MHNAPPCVERYVLFRQWDPVIATVERENQTSINILS